MVRGNISFAPKASTDLRSISIWYNQQKEGLADDFLKALDEILKKVERNPTAFTFARRLVRRCKVKKFPYNVYYSHLNGIVVVRVRHVKQKPLKRFT